MRTVTLSGFAAFSAKIVADKINTTMLRVKLKQANRDADVLQNQIKNDMAALAYVQKQQAIIQSQLREAK